VERQERGIRILPEQVSSKNNYHSYTQEQEKKKLFPCIILPEKIRRKVKWKILLYIVN